MAPLRQKLTIYLEPSLTKALADEADVRKVPRTRAAADLLRLILLDEKGGLVDAVKTRLDRIEKRESARARELSVLKETLFLFIRVWLEHTPEIPDDQTDAMAAAAEQRFAGFLDLLSDSLEPDSALFANGGSALQQEAAP